MAKRKPIPPKPTQAQYLAAIRTLALSVIWDEKAAIREDLTERHGKQPHPLEVLREWHDLLLDRGVMVESAEGHDAVIADAILALITEHVGEPE